MAQNLGTKGSISSSLRWTYFLALSPWHNTISKNTSSYPLRHPPLWTYSAPGRKHIARTQGFLRVLGNTAGACQSRGGVPLLPSLWNRAQRPPFPSVGPADQRARRRSPTNCSLSPARCRLIPVHHSLVGGGEDREGLSARWFAGLRPVCQAHVAQDFRSLGRLRKSLARFISAPRQRPKLDRSVPGADSGRSSVRG